MSNDERGEPMSATAVNAAIRNVLGDDVYNALISGRFSLPQRLRVAVTEAFVRDLRDSDADTLRKAELHLRGGRYFTGEGAD